MTPAAAKASAARTSRRVTLTRVRSARATEHSRVLARVCGLLLLAHGLPSAFVCSALAQSAGATRVEGVAAAIGGGTGETAEMILHSDVELRARMLLLGRDREQALAGELPRGLLAASLRELIGERLIAREAERVQITRPTAASLAEERQRMLAAAGGVERVTALLSRLGARSSELDATVQRRALVGAFLRANLEGTTVISEREVDERVAQDAARFAGRDPALVRAEVRAGLARLALARNIERWVRVLRARVQVRIYPPFEG